MAFANLLPLESWWPPSAAGILLALTALYAFALYLSSRKLDPREPEVVAPAVPLVGHVLGMAIFGGRYVKNLGIRRPDLPIFTLPVPGSRLYIVTDPGLAAAVQRAPRALSFLPLVPELTRRVLGLDAASVAIARRRIDDDLDLPATTAAAGPPRARGFLTDIQDMVTAQLAPGAYLGRLSLRAARDLRDEIGTWRATALDPPHRPAAARADLLAWVRGLVTRSTARSLYGARNPVAADASLADAFWDFDGGLGGLLAGVWPAATARRAHAGRERLVAALETYLARGEHLTGDEAEDGPGCSAIVRRRVAIALAHGWALGAVAREELSFLFAGIVNATTTAFWVLAHAYADAALLAAARREVEAALEPAEEEGGGSRRRLSIAALRDRCPALAATYRECLRLGSDTYSTRLVREDTLLAGRHWLRRGAVVQVAGGVMHADARIWGADAAAFDHRRFLEGPEAEAKKRNKNKVHPAAFRAFGGGKTLCPGRHFATNEILALVALVVLQFDARAPDGGPIEVPRKNDGVLPVHVLEPVRPVEVVISERADGFAAGGLDVEFVL
ncbi:cytochrome P450 [Durotheca rogersii]|uniref:cytochrome P450 n=1 Tax=Durotheca rogersii TaxID=419775 RepID=UPI00221FC5F8|nr:cytochrome P450 [Durotheca rogersii]KAI5866363.1 cytochrome P450 [Durotheca rogersii]